VNNSISVKCSVALQEGNFQFDRISFVISFKNFNAGTHLAVVSLFWRNLTILIN
jgi:hypothetical protein